MTVEQHGTSGHTRTRDPLVLMYHSVTDHTWDPYQVTVSPRRFARQMRWLAHNGRRGVSMRELLAARARGGGRRMVGLTFDDGYVDFATEVMPVLAAHGFTATLFVIADRLGGGNDWDPDGPRKPLLDAPGVRRAAAAGVELASHSLTHPRLTEVDPATLYREVADSRVALAGLVDAEVTGFAYPYGIHGAREVAAVAAAGYDYACVTGDHPIPGRFTYPRVYVGERDHAGRLYAKWARHRLDVREDA